MSQHAAADAASGALPVVAVIAVSCVIALLIAGWVIRDVARSALAKSREEDVPRVIGALGGLLGQFRLFLPWQGTARRSVAPEALDDQPASHTEKSRDLPKGGSR
jgi:hypothetical protein